MGCMRDGSTLGCKIDIPRIETWWPRIRLSLELGTNNGKNVGSGEWYDGGHTDNMEINEPTCIYIYTFLFVKKCEIKPK